MEITRLHWQCIWNYVHSITDSFRLMNYLSVVFFSSFFHLQLIRSIHSVRLPQTTCMKLWSSCESFTWHWVSIEITSVDSYKIFISYWIKIVSIWEKKKKITCSIRLSARLANDSRLVGTTGGTDVGNGGVDMVNLLICLFAPKYLFYLKLLIVFFLLVYLSSRHLFTVVWLAGWLVGLCAKMKLVSRIHHRSMI